MTTRIVRWLTVAVGTAVLVASMASCTIGDALDEPRPGDDCDDEGATEGDLVCEDGVWVRDDDDDLDAGHDTGDVDHDIGHEDTGPDADADTGQECEPESDHEFCERLEVECGEIIENDNCGDARGVDCGQFDEFRCDEPRECHLAEDDEQLETNICVCPDVDDGSDDEVCDLVGAECGAIDPGEFCQEWQELDEIDCGGCPEGIDCGDEIPNVCGCPCQIDGECYAEGQVDPDNECYVCDPDKADDAFVEDDGKCAECQECDSGSCVDGDQCPDPD